MSTVVTQHSQGRHTVRTYPAWRISMPSEVRPKRANTQTPSSYDETTRRGPKRARTAYMMRGEGRGEKRTAIELGVRVVDRIVDGAYEWRDAGLPALTPRGRQTDGQA